MAGMMRGAVWGLVGMFLAWGACRTGAAQEAAARPEVVPPPAPSGVHHPDHPPPPAYGPLPAGQDAYQMAEQQRRWAVERQTQLIQSAWSYYPWVSPYVAGVPHVYAYVPPRALRRAYRYGYGPVLQPWPHVSVGVYGYPYSTWARQPTGYEQVLVGPNVSVYRPYYGRPAQPQDPPMPGAPSPATPASPSTRPVAPAEQPSGPVLKGPIRPAPESIPTPPAVPPPGDS